MMMIMTTVNTTVLLHDDIIWGWTDLSGTGTRCHKLADITQRWWAGRRRENVWKVGCPLPRSPGGVYNHSEAKINCND